MAFLSVLTCRLRLQKINTLSFATRNCTSSLNVLVSHRRFVTQPDHQPPTTSVLTTPPSPPRPPRRSRSFTNPPWTPAEDTLLKAFVLRNGCKWTDVSNHVLPNRLPVACRSRWINVVNPSLRHGTFTHEERNVILQGVKLYGEGKWSFIANELLQGTRSASQVAGHWKLTLNPAIRRNRARETWEPDEDKLLVTGVERFGVGKWEEIARKMLPHRTRVQCRQRWVRVLDPEVSRVPWTEEEMEILLRRALVYGTENWWKVADGLPGRTPCACEEMWVRKVDPSRREDKQWRDEETNLFWARVEQFGNDWVKVAEALDGRSRKDCMHNFWRFAKQLREHVVKDDILIGSGDFARYVAMLINGKLSRRKFQRWTPQEDAQLRQIVESAGMGTPLDWNDVARQIPGRTPLQCKGRYTDHLSALIKGRWTADEDALLASLVTMHGHAWSKIASHVHGRTPLQCRRRWSNTLQYQQNNINPSTASNVADSASPRPAIQKGPLTNDEKHAVISAWAELGPDWSAVSRLHLPHRTPEQCGRVWRRSISGEIRKGRWMPEEDDALRFAVERIGGTAQGQEEGTSTSQPTPSPPNMWISVARLVQGRTPPQCRLRWTCTLRPGIRKGKWTGAETMRFLEAVERHGRHGNVAWENVARDVGGGRTAWACRQKYSRGTTNTAYRTWVWSAVEDTRLKEAVERYKDGAPEKMWEMVAREVGTGRSAWACRMRSLGNAKGVEARIQKSRKRYLKVSMERLRKVMDQKGGSVDG